MVPPTWNCPSTRAAASTETGIFLVSNALKPGASTLIGAKADDRLPMGPSEILSAVRYIAAELGPKGIRVHAISPGPLATRAASGIPEFDALLNKAKAKAPTRSLVSIDDVGVATAFLAHDAARLITGDTIYIDGGYHIMD